MIVTTSKKLPRDWTIIVYMILIHSFALFALSPSNFSWGAVGIAIFFYWVTGALGITLGFHRLVSHRSFQTPKWLEYLLVFCGTLACQGGVIQWVGLHRIHHKFSDTKSDPHDSKRGFWWSHMGWIIHKIPADKYISLYTQDISEDHFYKFCQIFMIPIQLFLGVFLYFLGGKAFVVWGVFVRLVVVLHFTWFVNSATHKFGYQSYKSNDNSRNCWWVALLTFGEGWHNNHHAYQYSARHGITWWEIDITWITIKFLRFLGLAKNVKLAPKSSNI